MRNRIHWFGRAGLVLLLMSVAGCVPSPSPVEPDAFHPTAGRYSAAPLGVELPRVGLPEPAVEVSSGAAEGDDLRGAGSEQLLALIRRTGRFNLIEHVRLAELVEQQGLSDVIRPGALVRRASLRGVDYLLLCRISNLAARGGERPTTVSVANVERLLHVSTPAPVLAITARVELRLVDPATGTAAAAVDDPVRRVGTGQSLGIEFASPDQEWGTLRLDTSQMSQVFRLVLDDAIRKLLPQVDRLLAQPPTPRAEATLPPATAPPATAPSVHSHPGTPLAAKIQCPECGFLCSPQDEFCPNCGARLPQKGVVAPTK